MPSKPNILIVMVDQLAPAFLPIYGHPLVKAPNLEALAERGVVFESAYCNSPLCSPSRTAFMTGAPALADRRLRQCRRVPRRPSHLRALPAAAGLSHHPVRQDAFLRAGPDAWLRGTAHHGHLPGRLRLDAGLGASARAAELVPQHELGHGRRALRAHQPDRFRRGGRLRGRAGDLRPRARQGRPAVPDGGFADPSARPVRHHAGLLEPLPPRGHRPAARRAAPTSRSTRTARACGMSAPWTRSRSPTSRSATPGTPITARSRFATRSSAG